MIGESNHRSLMRALLVWLIALIAIVFFLASTANGQGVARTAFVHLFEWRWDDVALECERFLGPKGFAAVQVSPPNEHRVVGPDPVDRPWWERYQPVSYRLISRSGDRLAFEDMVRRCQSVGVKVYVDAVINHMTGAAFGNDPHFGAGIGGSPFSYQSGPPPSYAYPAVPYGNGDFHACRHNINNFGDRGEVQNCNLVGLADLDTGRDDVRGKIADYLNHLVRIGVRGFRIDAAKHMDSNDIAAIMARVSDHPEVYQEVIEGGGEPIQAAEYFQNGLVTEFDYGRKLAEFFKRSDRRLADLRTFGESWQELMPSHRALVFIDNHDNQRGHGGGGEVLTHRDGRLYELANVFMLAWPYGYPRIMSSYAFGDPDAGPPMANGETRRVHDGNTLNCFAGEWVCEHRWRPIANMVAFRNHTISDFHVDNWWSNGNDQIAFGRGTSGFVVINKEGGDLDRTFQTGMAAGRYCNVWDGERSGDVCTGSVITVAADGGARIRVAAMSAAVIHVGARLPDGSAGGDVRRTVILIEGQTIPGQDMFIRGGIDHDHAATALGRQCAPNNFECAIPIQHRNLRNPTTQPWKLGDTHLDWYGREATQDGLSGGKAAVGTPLDWTTDRWPEAWGEKRTVAEHGFGEEPLNTYGPHYWMLDVDMDCARAPGGWFEFKSFISGGPGWEADVQQPGAPWSSRNHFARCGELNVFRRGESAPVEIRPLPPS